MIPHQTQNNSKAKSNKLHYFSLSLRFIIILDLSFEAKKTIQMRLSFVSKT
ncbi:hypothetical protein Bca4012_006099 [Brassica carinata]|uniref:BnaCnng11960D protein n=1 Tax=Brassica napus TaxID=3708 RepID=A0A078I1T9_BRANA|nr:BnaCnng11960D [Brassica napus]